MRQVRCGKKTIETIENRKNGIKRLKTVDFGNLFGKPPSGIVCLKHDKEEKTFLSNVSPVICVLAEEDDA